MLPSKKRQVSLQSVKPASVKMAVTLLLVAVCCAFVQAVHAHSGLVDGYGCHRGSDKVSYHCHQGEFVGRTFKSREDFLRRLRQGKSEQLSPRGNPAQPPALPKKVED
jgi:hypothetical protein